MAEHIAEYVIIRELTRSDFGWFAEPRDCGLVASKQRAINFNAPIVAKLLPGKCIESQEVFLHSKCMLPDIMNEEVRPLSKVGKNWRLGGRKVPGEVFLKLKESDLFICRIRFTSPAPYPMLWTVLFQDLEPELYVSVSDYVKSHLVDRMAIFEANDVSASPLGFIANFNKDEQTGAVSSNKSEVRKQRRKLSVKERLQQPHILQEMMKVSLSLSADAQRNFLAVLEGVASAVRHILMDAEIIRNVDIDHGKLWSEVKGRPISFIDGGTANLSSLGSDPIAVRVGSYTVTPGRTDSRREDFRIERQLIDELFDSQHNDGLFDDIFEDVAKLRDVARISVEAAGAVTAINHEVKPDFLFLHGALVNPVSSYALDGFPNFSGKGIKFLLPTDKNGRSGDDTNFISIYLKQLQLLMQSGINVCGVVERASASRIVIDHIFEMLKDLDGSPGSSLIEDAKQQVKDYRISDAVLFHCILNEGEYITPIEVDRNDLRRAPGRWKHVISQYPKPYVSYVGVGEMALPIRVEFFHEPPDGFELLIRLIIHSCRLMPNYAFPAGLDIVDKFAKVPQWMSRPINTTLAVQFLKKAMDTGNPLVIEEAKRMLCGTTRDWLFRPTFDQ